MFTSHAVTVWCNKRLNALFPLLINYLRYIKCKTYETEYISYIVFSRHTTHWYFNELSNIYIFLYSKNLHKIYLIICGEKAIHPSTKMYVIYTQENVKVLLSHTRQSILLTFTMVSLKYFFWKLYQMYLSVFNLNVYCSLYFEMRPWLIAFSTNTEYTK